ncbi:IPT/TIG domain-containing protein [Actinoplanes sp. CA-015351]|uniref:IPT/TIG domain-containing protein n=1 Tax=Actinoplanes sp. CA-015351 TaxID=3239897 RepID=UPI003D996DC7
MHVILRGAAVVTAGALILAGGAGAASGAAPAARPVVSGITPAKVSTAGGGTVTIVGKGFADVSTVTFGELEATSFDVVSTTKITAVVPAGSGGAVPVTVTAADGDSLVTKTTVVTYRTPLGIDVSDNPVAKASGGPLVLTVTGGTIGATPQAFAKELISVLVNRVKAKASYIDEDQLAITVPAIPADSAEVTVVHDSIAGETATITLAPVVTSLSVKYSTLAGGVKTIVKVAGASIGDSTDFMFGGNAADCSKEGSVASPSFICWVPAAEEAGPVVVSFTSGSGVDSSYTSAAMFSYTDN